MPLVFTLGSHGDILSAALGCRGGALHTAVLAGHRRVPGSSADIPVPDSCGVTQLAGAHRRNGLPQGTGLAASE